MRAFLAYHCDSKAIRKLAQRMSLGLCFWIVMLVGLLVYAWAYWPRALAPGVTPAPGPSYRLVGPSLIFWLLLVLLGWGTFGSPIK